MPILHMETELVRSTGQQLQQTAVSINQQLQTLRRSVQGLTDSSWQGPSSQAFHNEMEPVLAQMAQLTKSGSTLNQRLQREVDEWEQVDSQLGGTASIEGPGPADGRPAPATGPDDIWSFTTGMVGGVFGKAVDFTDGIIDKAVGINDEIGDQFWSTILHSDDPNSTETLKFELDGDVTIPLGEVGAPTSLILGGGSDVWVTRNPDGTYNVTLVKEGEVGLSEDLIAAEGKLKFGKNKYGVGVDAGVEGVGYGTQELTLTFDPDNPGDLSKMNALLGTLGLSKTAGVTVPGLDTVTDAVTMNVLKDNITGMEFGLGAQVQGEADIHAIVELAGVDGNVYAEGTSGIHKNDLGHWETRDSLAVGGGVHGNLVKVGSGGIEGEIRVEGITNLQTGGQQAKVYLDLQLEHGKQLELHELQHVLPKGTDLSGVKINYTDYDKFTIEYTLNEPAASVQQTLNDSWAAGQPDLSAIVNNSEVEMSQVSGTELGLGASGKVGIATQTIGIGGEGNIARESEKTLWHYSP